MRSTILRLAAVLATIVAVDQTASAQTKAPAYIPPVAVDFDPDFMRILVMRSQEPGCEPTCAEWISLQGNFRDSSVGEFRKVLSKLGKRKLPVLVHSTGGRLDPAMAIGKQIRAKGLDVIVAKTALVRCTAGDADCRRMLTIGVEPGKVEFGPTSLAICAGSCPMVLAAGVQRHVGPFAAVGLTQFTSIQTHRRVRREYRLERTGGGFFKPPEVRKKLISEETLSEKKVEKPADEKAYAKIATYFKEMGIADGIMTYQRQATEGRPSILRQPELQTTQLATGFMSAIQYLRPAPPPTTTAPAGPVLVTPDGTRIGPAPAAPSAATTTAPPAAPTPPSAAGGIVPPPGPPASASSPADTVEQPKPQPAAVKQQPKPKPKPAARPSGDASPGSIFQ